MDCASYSSPLVELIQSLAANAELFSTSESVQKSQSLSDQQTTWKKLTTISNKYFIKKSYDMTCRNKFPSTPHPASQKGPELTEPLNFCTCLFLGLLVLFSNTALFSLIFRAVLIRFAHRGLVLQGQPNLRLFDQLFWVISAVQNIQKWSEPPGTAPMVVKLCIVEKLLQN